MPPATQPRREVPALATARSQAPPDVGEGPALRWLSPVFRRRLAPPPAATPSVPDPVGAGPASSVADPIGVAPVPSLEDPIGVSSRPIANDGFGVRAGAGAPR
jgi:hypothetical protein